MGVNKTWATILGVVFLAIGILGFFTGETLLVFGINSLHNVVHLVSGAVLLWAGLSAGAPTKQVNTTFGVIYGLVGIVGFFGVLGFLNVNTADNWLHLAIAVVSLAVGTMAD